MQFSNIEDNTEYRNKSENENENKNEIYSSLIRES